MGERQEQEARIPVTIVTGFLGSGKTTFIQRLLKERHGMRIAVLQNEFSSTMGIEKPILSAGGASVFELPNGCLCCSLKDGIVEAVESILKFKHKFEWLVVEAAGNVDPLELTSSFWVDPESPLVLDGVLSITCPAVLLDILYTGSQKKDPSTTSSSTVPEECVAEKKANTLPATNNPSGSRRFRFLGKDTMEGQNMRELMIKQLSVADVIIVNKMDQKEYVAEHLGPLLDTSSPSTSEACTDDNDPYLYPNIKAIISLINPSAMVLKSSFCNVDLDAVMNLKMFSASRILSFRHTEKCNHRHHKKHDKGESSVFVKTQGTYSLSQLNELVSKILWESDATIYRCKGIFQAIKDCEMITDPTGEIATFQLQGVGMLFEITEVTGILLDDNRFLLIGPNLNATEIRKALATTK